MANVKIVTKIHQILLFIDIMVSMTKGIAMVNLKMRIQISVSKHQIQLNCTTCGKPIPIAAFRLDNESFANIARSHELCFIGQKECKPEECKCGPNFFFYNFTTDPTRRQYFFTCEVRFNVQVADENKHFSVQSSVFYNETGTHVLKEIKEEKSAEEDTVHENKTDDGGLNWVPVICVLGLLLLIVILSCYLPNVRNTCKESLKTHKPHQKGRLDANCEAENEPEIDAAQELIESNENSVTDNQVEHVKQEQNCIIEIHESEEKSDTDVAERLPEFNENSVIEESKCCLYEINETEGKLDTDVAERLSESNENSVIDNHVEKSKYCLYEINETEEKSDTDLAKKLLGSNANSEAETQETQGRRSESNAFDDLPDTAVAERRPESSKNSVTDNQVEWAKNQSHIC